MSVASGDGSGQAMSREQRRMEREEKRRKRNAQDPSKQTSSSTRLEKTPNKDDKKKGRSEFSVSNGSATKKPPSGSKRTQQSYDKVKIIEKTPPQDVPEKENKGKSANDSDRSTTRRRPGTKFMDNLSKFENQAKQKETKERSSFVRSYRNDSSQADRQDPTFRRSYRPNRSAPIVDDPSILTRRSLRKEKVLESIARLEKNSPKSTLKKPQLSPTLERSKGTATDRKSSRPTSASSSRTSVSDSGSSSSSLKSGQKSRAQQALERHKERMRSSSMNGPSSPHKPGSPSSKAPTESTHKTPKTPSDSKSKTPRSKKPTSQTSLDSPSSYDEPVKRTISVTKSLLDGDDALQITTETEVVTPMQEKMNIVVKESAKSMEDVAELMSPVEPTEEQEYKPGDPRPLSVGDAVAMFSPEEKTPSPEPVAPPSGRKKRVRRKLPEIPIETQDNVNRKHSRKNSSPEDGSGEPSMVSPMEQGVVVIETSPTFPEAKRTSSNFNQNSNYESRSPTSLSLSPVYGCDQIDPKVKSRSSRKRSKSDKETAENEVFEAAPESPMRVVETPPLDSLPDIANEDPVAVPNSPTRVALTPKKTEKKYSPEEAIRELRKMSEEVQSSGTKHDEEQEVAEVEESVVEVKPRKERRRSSRSRKSPLQSPAEDRPKSLHIEEVLYISEAPEESPKPQEKPRKSSLEKQLSEEIFVAGEPVKHSDPRRKLKSLDLTPFEIPSLESPQKTPKSPKYPSNKSLNKTPSPTPTAAPKSPLSAKSSSVKSPTAPQSSTPLSPILNETPSSVKPKSKSSSRKSSASGKSPTSPLKQILATENIVASPVEPTVTPKTPLRSPKSPTKVTESLAKPKSPILQEKSVPEVKETQIEKEEKKIFQEKPIKEEEMTGKRGLVARRYKKSWLDESDDDDNISLLSDAASDDLEIDLKWLGSDSEDDYMPLPRKSSLGKVKSNGVQRSSSKAADMLALWERKAAEPVKRTSPSKRIETEVRVGSVKTAWETKKNGVQNGKEKEDRERKTSVASLNGTSENGSPAPPRRKSVDKRNQSEEEKSEMKDIFNVRVSGKIQGAKALFENIAQAQRSPSRSPVVKRSPIKVRQDSTSSSVSVEPSPEMSRKSSVSSTQVSEEISPSQEVAEESQNVDEMRAMFENRSQRKEQTRRNKPLNKSAEKSKPQSRIQQKAAAKKKGRRSMTQPITTDDVKMAQNMMSSSTGSEVEEETINFADRLKFFNKLLISPAPKPKAKASPTVRRQTQPVDQKVVEQVSPSKGKKFDKNAISTEPVEIKAACVEVQKVEKVEPSEPPAQNDLHSSDVQESETANHLDSLKEKINGHIDQQPSSDAGSLPQIDQSPITSVRRAIRQFSISSSSDNESLLSSSSTSIDDPEPGRKKLILSFSSSEDDMSVSVAEIKSTGSIHDRLKRLQQKNTEEKWKKKPLSEIKTSSVGDRLNKLKGQEDKWKKTSNEEFVSRVDKLSERIARIKDDSNTWKTKTGQQNDAAQFTVQAKIAKREGQKNIQIIPSPSVKRRVMMPVLPSRVVTEKEASDVSKSSSMNALSSVERLANKGLEENVIKKSEVKTIEVPQIDTEVLEQFFGVTPKKMSNGDANIKFEIEDLPELQNSTQLSDVGRLKSNVQQNSKRKSAAKNPLKALAARTDLKQSYDTQRSNIASLEQQRIAVQRGNAANFTSAALAGLAAKADLKKVNLRSTKDTPMPSSDDLRPFKDVMLLRAKGRRQVQTRLVEPSSKSLSSDDAFLLVTPKKLFAWFGEFCNVIEKAKINEIADYIMRKGDLGCKVTSYTSISEVSTTSVHKEFWESLGGMHDWDKASRPGADEQYEVDATETIKTYKMIDSKLVPHEEAWGKLPKMGMLTPSDTFVFDFGAEMYIWQGREVSFADRRLAVRLARVIWDQGYDYTEFGVCPFHGEELKGGRPSFGIFARVNENLETSLFQEKFEDWSNIYREIGEEEAVMRETSRGKSHDESKTKSSIVTEDGPYDVTKMKNEAANRLPLLIEGYDVSRGDGDITDEDGRILEIVTSQVEAFQVTESSVEKFDDCVLHRSNSYVIKWKYSISSTGRFLKSKEKENGKTDSSNGRHRVAYFAWAGVDSPTNDKGASALIASNMDTDDGPIITVEEPTAPLVFNKCFGGKLLVMSGKRGEKRGAYNWRLFMVKGESPDSTALVEVPCEVKSLRSSSSFVTLLPKTATAIVWHGCLSPKKVREAAEEAIEQVSSRMPDSLPFRRNPTCLEISVCEEGKESDLFREAIGILRRTKYESLLESEVKEKPTRAWKFTNQSESFVALELNPVEPGSFFPLVQEQLLEVETPSLLLVECTFGAFMWQNIGPEELTGTAKRRWDVIRRLGMETTLKYCEENNLEEATLIEAGNEPNSFTNAFLSWKTKEKSKFDKSSYSKPRPIRDILSTLSRVTYTLEELRAPQLPDGVDARHLETYLTNSDFVKLFEMERSEFYELPAWKQTKLRKQKKLF